MAAKSPIVLSNVSAITAGYSGVWLTVQIVPAEPFVGNLSFYHFNMIISGACTVVVLFMIFGLMGRHAMRMSNPQEQLK